MKNTWQPSYSHQDVDMLSEVVAYDSWYVRVLNQKFRFRMFSGDWGSIVERISVASHPAVAVLLYHPEEDTVLMVEQFRHGALNEPSGPWLLEPVAGIIENDDSATTTANREAMEEAGCVILDLIPACKYLASSGISNEIVQVFCGRINTCKSGSIHGLASEGEDIKVHVLPAQEAFNLLNSGKIISSSAVISLQWLQLHLKDLRKKWLTQG